VDRDDRVVVGREVGEQAAGDLAGRLRGGRKRARALGQVEEQSRLDRRSVEVLARVDAEMERDDLDLVAVEQVARQVADRVGDVAIG
jgi:hypothetical protein